MTKRFRLNSNSRLSNRWGNKQGRNSRRSIFGNALSAGLASSRRALSVEPLEDRRLLSVTTAYVANAADFTDAANPGNPQAGDTVTWNGGGQFNTPVAGLTFGTDAFTSIAAAVANVSAGGTVDIAPGTYNEHEIAINQAITLDGPNFGVNPNGAGPRGAEAIIDAQSLGGGLVINGNNVTVDGLTVQGADNGSEAGIVMGPTTSGVQVLNNIITNNEMGIFADSNGSSKIQNNLITANNVAGPAGGAGVYSEFSDGLVIDGNVFTDNNINSSLIFAATAAGVHKNLQVSNNTVVESAANANSSIYAVSLDGAVFSGNDISGGLATALKFAGDDVGVSVVNNSLHGANVGVAVVDDGYGFGASSNITINDNSLTGNTTQALQVDAGAYTGALDATKNWWGDISGPTIASNVGGLGQLILDPDNHVAYRPWLIYGTDADAATTGFQLPTTVTVATHGDVSPALNDFTLLQNAIGAAAAGQTIDLSGAFNWTATNSALAYAASNATGPTNDIRGVALPDGVNNLTITSSAQNATITGGGDSTDAAYNAFVFSAVSGAGAKGNDNLTISNLNINNFESGVFLGWNNGGMFNGTLVKNNTITVAGDSDNNQPDGFQSIAVYFWNGQNQTMTGNTVDFMGNGTRTTGNGAFSYGFQDGTTGGTGYNGLSIDHNVFQLLPSAVGGSEVVTGVWENGHNDDNASHISIAANQFLGIQGQRQFDNGVQLSSQTTNMSIDGNTFTDVKYVYWVGTHNGDAPGDQFTFSNNSLTRVGDANGVFLQNKIDNTPGHIITINWGTNNTIDGLTGIRGLNELSTQATGASRPTGGAADLNAVDAFGPMPVDFVNSNWGAAGRFTNPLASPDGTPGPIAFGFNTFATVQDGVNAVDVNGATNVLAGTYAENVTVNKNITLTGLDATSPPTAIIHPAAGDGITIAAPASNVTVANLEVTGASTGVNAGSVASVTLDNLLLDANATGLTASTLVTLNLTNLTLTGNTTAGGNINNTLTVNDTPITGSVGATDTITGSSIQRGVDQALNYSGVVNLNVTGSAGSDTFDVTPSPVATAITIDGGLPNPPTLPGDTLNVPAGGTLTPTFDPATGYSGSFASAGNTSIAFNHIETLSGTADLSITKTDGKANVVAGTSDTYTIVVTNSGPSSVTGASVTDAFPADFTGATYTATATGGAAGFTASGSGDISDTVDLPSGSTITYVVTGTVSASASGSLSNTAAVAAPAGTIDANTANNSATDTDSVTAQVAPAITSANSADFAEGSSNTFLVTASGIPTPTLTEAGSLPSGVTFIDNGNGTATLSGTPAAGTQGDYTLTITAHNGVGSDATQTFTLTVSPATIQTTGFGPLAGVPGDGSIQTFVHNLYRELLGREPDATGSAFWTNFLQQNNNAVGRLQVITSFLNSPEYKEHYVTTVYELFLGRAPEASGLQFWTNAMGSPGTPGAHGGSGDEKFVLSAILGSDEFYGDSGNTAQGWVNALYQDLLGRPADASGLAYWSGQAQGASATDRDGLVRSFLSAPEAEHLLLNSFSPSGTGGTAAHPLPAPGTPVAAGSSDLAILTGDGWENLYLQGPFDNSPQGNDAFFAELAAGVAWDDVQLHLLATDQFYTNPNRPTTL